MDTRMTTKRNELRLDTLTENQAKHKEKTTKQQRRREYQKTIYIKKYTQRHDKLCKKK